MNLSEIKFLFNKLKNNIIKLKTIIDYKNISDNIINQEKNIYTNTFWTTNTNEKNKILKEIQNNKNIVIFIENLNNSCDDIEIFIELLDEEENIDILNECMKKIYDLEKKINSFMIKYLLSEEDNYNAILSINAGAGGLDSQDWVAILLRMYTRWCEKNNFNIKIIESVTLDNIGFRNITIIVKGENAYGYLKSENGIHRLIRISPFNNANKRHTSFAAVEVIPEIDNKNFYEIKNNEIKIDTFRSSGAGGQSVNKTESAIRITHLQTGITVTCQNERSQYQNKELAMKILYSKLFKLNETNNQKQITSIRNAQKMNEWGNQIRSYIFMPYTLVKDHRTDFQTGNINSILNGDINDFILAFLKKQKKLTNNIKL